MDHLPKKGEIYTCSMCGMALQITADCKCDEAGEVELKCCSMLMKPQVAQAPRRPKKGNSH